MKIAMRQANEEDAEAVAEVLRSAARWLEERGTPMWKADELSSERLAVDIARGEFFVADVEGQVAGTLKFQLEDPLFWPEMPLGEAAYIHRLAVRREFAGGGISAMMIEWAAARASTLGRRFLRLDCEASRLTLRAVYERAGFRHHSDREVAPYFVARYERMLAIGH